ncbi:potassium-transporting ATPase subunit KdpA, partial [Listeria monocytogenes]|nr:potassium-transporting ATPase subunit KdpA [Listeria monocytogenes]
QMCIRDRAFNTAASFVSNTNWQAYSGETALSYFSQSIGLTVQNFVRRRQEFRVFLAVFGASHASKRKTGGIFCKVFFEGRLIILLHLPVFSLLFLFHTYLCRTLMLFC